MSGPATASAAGAPRWHIDAQALSVLESVFVVEMFPNVEARKQLGLDLNVSPRQIQVWFQNRRQRERKRKEKGARSGGIASTSRPVGLPAPACKPPTSSSCSLSVSSSDLSSSTSSTTLCSSSEDISSALLDFGDGVATDPTLPSRRGLSLGLAPVPILPEDRLHATALSDGRDACDSNKLFEGRSEKANEDAGHGPAPAPESPEPPPEPTSMDIEQLPPLCPAPSTATSASAAAPSPWPPSELQPAQQQQAKERAAEHATIGGRALAASAPCATAAPSTAPSLSSAAAPAATAPAAAAPSCGGYDLLAAMRTLLPGAIGMRESGAAGGAGGLGAGLPAGLAGGLAGALGGGALDSGLGGGVSRPATLSEALFPGGLGGSQPSHAAAAGGRAGATSCAAAALPLSTAAGAAPSADGMPSVAARLAAACQSSLLGRTLQQFGGIVQVCTRAVDSAGPLEHALQRVPGMAHRADVLLPPGMAHPRPLSTRMGHAGHSLAEPRMHASCVACVVGR
jgi:hypothetical protein